MKRDDDHSFLKPRKEIDALVRALLAASVMRHGKNIELSLVLGLSLFRIPLRVLICIKGIKRESAGPAMKNSLVSTLLACTAFLAGSGISAHSAAAEAMHKQGNAVEEQRTGEEEKSGECRNPAIPARSQRQLEMQATALRDVNKENRDLRRLLDEQRREVQDLDSRVRSLESSLHMLELRK